ncbi:MAG TPA: insulinase family protein [Polyangia bacterium]|nr:insulinase family protein [Polyangia bacterium]
MLSNGLTVVLAPDHEIPLTGMALCYRVGTRDDPPARPGLTALVPRLMVRATEHVAEGQYDRALDAAGAVGSRWLVEPDRTCFRTTVPAAALALPLWLWSDQMGFFVGRLEQRLIDQQVVTLRNEHVQKIENTLLGHLADLASATIYPQGHPYRAAAFPDGDALRSIGIREMRAFVEGQYTPQRATLVLSGDFDPLAALRFVQMYFGTIPRGPEIARPTAAPALLATQTRLHVAANVEFPSVTLVWPTAPLYQPGDGELNVLAELLVGPRAGLLRFKLVDELGIASSVTAHQLSRQLGSLFAIHATATAGHSPAELTDAIDGVLRALQSAGPNGYLMGGSITGYMIDKLFGIEAQAQRASLYGRCQEEGILGHCFETWTGRYSTLEAWQISSAAARELPLDHRVVIEVAPSADAPVAGALRP